MAGFLLNTGATVVCAHGGRATAAVANPRLIAGGAPTLLLSAPWTIAGCPLPAAAGGPCVTAQWIAGTVRVTSNGQPLVVTGGVAICAPTGAPLLPVATQTRVTVS
jgi:hypothetical protein